MVAVTLNFPLSRVFFSSVFVSEQKTWDSFSSLWLWPFSSPASSKHPLILSQTSLLIYNPKVFEVTNCSFFKQKAELVDQPAGTGTKLEEQTSEELSQAPYLSTSYAHREISQDNWKLAQFAHITQQQKSFMSLHLLSGLIPTGSRRKKYEYVIIPSWWIRKGPIWERPGQSLACYCMAEWLSSGLGF